MIALYAVGVGSIPGLVVPKTLKMVSAISLLLIQYHFEERGRNVDMLRKLDQEPNFLGQVYKQEIRIDGAISLCFEILSKIF